MGMGTRLLAVPGQTGVFQVVLQIFHGSSVAWDGNGDGGDEGDGQSRRQLVRGEAGESRSVQGDGCREGNPLNFVIDKAL
jgi:hypothetical protein